MSLALAFCAVFSGCAVREPLAPETDHPETTAKTTYPNLSFNDKVATLPEGSTQYFSESPFGSATVDAGPRYLSGLGNECRLARVTCGKGSFRFTLCKEENAKWRFIPTIFESMPR